MAEKFDRFRSRLILFSLVLALGIVFAAPYQRPSLAAEDKPTPVPGPNSMGMGMMSSHERLARPAMSDPPTQIELGHAEYWMSCMVCHGDRGQGLTPEWRSVLDPADQNCWQSKCHAPNHPPEGFEIPREAPLVMGTGALSGYQTAAELYEYLRVEMPWSFPGLFEDEKYWELTAYLAEANKIDLPAEPLGPENGGEILLVPGMVQAHDDGIGMERIVAGTMMVLFLGALAVSKWPGSPTDNEQRDSETDGDR